MDLEINLDLEHLIASLPDNVKQEIRIIGNVACFIGDQVTLIVNLKVNDNCTLRGIWEKE